MCATRRRRVSFTFRAAAGLALAAVPLASAFAQATPSEEDPPALRIQAPPAEFEERELAEAKPRPMPEDVARTDEPDEPNDRHRVVFDPRTGRVRIVDNGLPPTFELPEDRDDLGEALYPEGRGLTGGAVQKGATPIDPIFYTTNWPYRATGKLKMRFSDGWSECSASTTDEFHVLTAGHCIYDHDLNEWAVEVRYYAAQTNAGVIDGVQRPYGEARGKTWGTYEGWWKDEKYKWDMAVVRLDRPVGERTGWMGRSSSTVSNLNFAGYPVESAYGWAGETMMYHGFDKNNRNWEAGGRIGMDAYVFGGMSGGPVWKSLDGDRKIVGVNSTSDREGKATATDLNDDKRDDINDYMDESWQVDPPDYKADVRAYNQSLMDVLTPDVLWGDDLKVKYALVNMGYASSGIVNVKMYLSKNTSISEDDYYVGVTNLNPMDAWTAKTPTLTRTVPNTIPVGEYYVGFLFDPAASEYAGGSSDNKIVLLWEKVYVHGPSMTCGTLGTAGDASATAGLLLLLPAALFLRRRLRTRG